jgi:hypothetical protein
LTVPFCIVCLLRHSEYDGDANQPPHAARSWCGPRHKPDFGEKPETIMSSRQHRPDGQNPIATASKPEKYGASMAAISGFVGVERCTLDREPTGT